MFDVSSSQYQLVLYYNIRVFFLSSLLTFSLSLDPNHFLNRYLFQREKEKEKRPTPQIKWDQLNCLYLLAKNSFRVE